MIKLIASDVDGTLVAEGTSDINPQLFDKIRELKKLGITFVAASGRQYPSVISAFPGIADEIMFVADNGAYIFDQGKPLQCNYIPRETWVEIVKFCKKDSSLCVMTSSMEGCYSNSEDQFFFDLMKNGYGLDLIYKEDLTQDDFHVTKIAVYCKNANPHEFAEKAKELFGDAAAIVVSGTNWVDFIAKGVNKAAAISWIQNKLGVTPEETMVFGDQDNDIEMMGQGVESYAVSNARDTVKKAAKYVMDEGAADDGVLHILNNLFSDKLNVTRLYNESCSQGVIGLLGLDRVKLVDGNITITVEMDDRHINARNIVHGGVMYTICDQACAAHDICLGRPAVGMECSMHYYKPAYKGDVLTATVKNRKEGKKVTVHLVELKNQRDELVADGMMSSMYLD